MSQSLFCELSFTQSTSLQVENRNNFDKFVKKVKLLSNFFLFRPIFSSFANSDLRNGNPVNWTVLSSRILYIHVRYCFSKIFRFALKLTKKIQN